MMTFLTVLASVFLAAVISASPVPEAHTFAKNADGSINYKQIIAEGTCGQCDLSSASLPQSTPPLPPPSAGLSLYHVAIGRGTQNYTCDLSNSSAVPAAIGAKATLFNVTCLAANSPDLVTTAANVALGLSVPSGGLTENSAYYAVSGVHYFIDTTTPFFDLNTANHSYGSAALKKLAAEPAPSGALVGQKNVGYGAVPWLKLTSAPTYGKQSFSEVYRVRTAGGNPPASCAGQQASFQIQYSAEYWFFA